MDEDSCSPSSAIASSVDSLSANQLTGEVFSLVERSLTDTLGVMLAGLDEEPAVLTKGLVRAHGGHGQCSICGSELSTSPMNAALVHGTAAHSLDYDDTAAAINGHPSASIVPSVLSALGSEAVSEPPSGEDILVAYVAGFETQSRIAAPVLDSHYRAGWHTTATLGPFGAAAATGKLLGLDVTQLEHALNIAASMASGLKENFGSMTKSLHAGHAARSGLTATLLARQGFTAGSEALGPEGGFLDLYSGNAAPDIDAFDATGERLYIQEAGIHLKKYPCCYYTHAAIEETIDLVTANDIAPADVDQVSVRASPGAVDAANIDDPQTELEGKFSMRFLVACAVVRRAVRFESFERETLFDDRVRDLMERVSFEVDDDIPYGSLSADVAIQTRAGDLYQVENASAPGLYGVNPLSTAELHDKFVMCATTMVDSNPADELWDLLSDFRSVPDATALVDSLP